MEQRAWWAANKQVLEKLGHSFKVMMPWATRILVKCRPAGKMRAKSEAYH